VVVADNSAIGDHQDKETVNKAAIPT
jgi:hypothetical protein